MTELKLDREAQQIFNAEADVAIRERNANILPQMLASDKIIESMISEKIKELQHKQNKHFAAKVEPKLDAYLRNENDKALMMKMFLVSNIHHLAKNITRCMLENEITEM